MKITIVGNIHSGQPAYDGGTLKIKNVFNALKQLGYNPNIIDVDLWKKHPFSIFRKIRKSLLQDDIFILMCAGRGSRLLLRLTAHIKRKTKYVFCPVGTGTVNRLTDGKLTAEQEQRFLNCENFYGLNDRRMAKILASIDSVVIENAQLKKVYETFYGLTNVHILTNFRFFEFSGSHTWTKKDAPLKVVYLTRLTRGKGILDLLDVVNEINSTSHVVDFDIFGKSYLSDEDFALFKSKLSKFTTYHGAYENEMVMSTLQHYDLYCLPINSHEGTPGSLIEAILARIPCLISSIGQASEFIDDEYDGFIFKFGSKEDLKAKLLYIADHRELLPLMSERLKSKAEKFTFDGNKENIRRFFCLD